MFETLVSSFGKLVTYDEADQRVCQIDFKAITARSLLIDVSHVPSLALRFRDLDGKTVDVSPGDFRIAPAFPTERLHLDNLPCSGDQRAVAIRLGQKYLRSRPDGSVDFGAEMVLDWEVYQKISFEMLADLRALCLNDWIVYAGRRKISSDTIAVSDREHMEFGDQLIEICRTPLQDTLRVKSEDGWNLPVSGVLFRDFWKHDKLMLYRPLIVYCVFGENPDLLEQLRISLGSLVVLGAYTQNIMIIGDMCPDRIMSFVPAELRSKVTLRRLHCKDRLDMVAARLSICQDKGIEAFQPILYVDLDIVFDRPVEPMLIDLAISDMISAQVEDFNPLGADVQSGLTLYKDDPTDCFGKFGFCGGVLGIPSVARSGWAIRAASRALAAYTNRYGRDSIPFYEQAMLNYSLYRLGCFQADPVTSATSADIWHNGDDLVNRRGLVHFWRAMNKVISMQSYFDRVRSVALY